MTELAPHPDDWVPLNLDLQPGDGGHAGTLSVGTVTYHVRRWRLRNGRVQAEIAAERDPAWEAFLDGLGRSTEA